MASASDYATSAALIGTGATAILDFWAFARNRVSGAALPDYGMVGRWFGHMLRGRFRHEAIAAAPPVQGERFVGWTAHYAIGVAFAAVLLGVWGLEWSRQPTIGPAMIVGLGSVLAPFLLMQPGMGAGFAARRTPRPAAARLRSLTTHAIFGLALYAAGWLACRMLVV